MTQTSSVFFVGRDAEVAHHAAPFRQRCNVRVEEPEAVLKHACPGDVALFYSEHFDRFRDTCLQLKRRNVGTLYLIDGILEWRNAWETEADEIACPFTMRPALADKIACIGASQARVLDSWGNHGKTEVVGIPRLENLRESFFNPIKSHAPDQAPFRLLVMTAKTPAFTADQWQRTRQSLRDIRQWAETSPVIAGRPVEISWRLTRGLEHDLGVIGKAGDLTGVELAKQLEQVDAVVTTPSTSMLEAMIRDLPVALLDYHHCPHYVQCGWDIACREHIQPTIEAMAQRPERRMLFQRNQLADALYLESSAIERITDLIASMQDLAQQQLAARRDQPLDFPAGLLSKPIGYSAEFSLQRLYPEFEEFQNRDRAMLQAQLAHSRRHIDALNREIVQLQSELGQAHQIFESINKHPIAGPIVRIRKKMLDLIGVHPATHPPAAKRRIEVYVVTATAQPAFDGFASVEVGHH